MGNMPALKLRTGHPVLVYKTSRIQRTVLRLFFLSTPTIEPFSQFPLAFAILCLLLSHFCLYISYLQTQALVVKLLARYPL